MKHTDKGCRDDLLTALVQGVLEETWEDHVASHLDECDRCRQQLKAVTATSDLWQDIRETLKEQPFDAASSVLSTGQISQTLSGRGHLLEDPDHQSVLAPSIQHVLKTLSPTDDPSMMGRLGHHEVQGVIGAGGMGVVLKAFDPSLDRMVAIKILAPHLATSGAARQRFSREAKAAAAVLHPNVVAIHGVSDGGHTGLPYLVMPYVRGTTLQVRIDRDGGLSLTEILQVAVQVADGLAAAHQQGLVHRDIKPANIMLEDGVERVTIMDFGLARTVDDATLTQSGVIAGTPQYMSPEQARGDAVDAHSDLFSLGSLLYVMSTGHPPFRAETAYGILRRITDETARPVREVRPDLPEWLGVLITRLHARFVDDRFQTASEVADVLRACLAHVQSPSATLPEVVRPVRIRAVRARTIIGMSSAAALTLAALLWNFQHDPNLPQRSQASGGSVADREGSVPSTGGQESSLTETEIQQPTKSFSWQSNSELDLLKQQTSALNETTKKLFESGASPE